MSRAAEIIQDTIRKGGPIGVHEFMEIALADPQGGYYMTRDPFGAAGDFTTAPEISQMFGEMIGVWMALCWQRLGSPSSFALLECGPGRGTLMADLMRGTKSVPGFHKAAHIYLMEISPVLKDKQADALEDYDVRWIEDLNKLPPGLPVLCVANEFFDALPIRQYTRQRLEWKERAITTASLHGLSVQSIPLRQGSGGRVDHTHEACDDGLVWTDIPLQKRKDFPVLPEGAIIETCEAAQDIARHLFRHISKNTGAALVIDYGYEGPAAGDTLQALYRHKPCDPLTHVGQADLTAHVDFTPLRAAAENAGIEIMRLATQGQFLRNMGIDVRAQSLRRNASPKQVSDIENALHRLMSSDQMGTLFKVLGVYNGPGAGMAGF